MKKIGLIAILQMPNLAFAEEGGATAIGTTLPLWMGAPFLMLLVAIAVISTAWPHWWESNRNKTIVAAVCAAPILIWGLMNAPEQVIHTGLDYTKFIVLIGALFIVTGGIHLSGDIRATPRNNTLLLLLGAVIANPLGTTGASLVFIRPFISMNRERKNTWHQPLFFIFLVGNIGGTLLPTGNPPLYMGYLSGVPFFWTLSLIPQWALVTGSLLVMFYLWDSIAYAGESPESLKKDETQIAPLRMHGGKNVSLLMLIIAAIIFVPSPWRELIMIATAGISIYYTPMKGDVRRKNQFNFGPVTEVAILFAGIFIALIPVILILNARGSEIPLTKPWQFFTGSGLGSGFFDSAPAYMVGLATGQAQGYTGTDAIVGVNPATLKAISCGTSFLGILSYLGNAPNLLVKAIYEENGYKLPSFGGYIVWAFALTTPIFVVLNVLFFGLKLW